MEPEEKKTKLKNLVELFGQNIEQYKSGGYDEANTRADFIDKFFELLEWDVRNIQGFSEQYREVVREDKIRIEGKHKAPDYSFRIGGLRKFFIEAKRPSINIKEANEPAYQIRRYGYTAKLPISILTNFEELAIYDTRIKPDKNDKASAARIFYCKFDEYEKQFEFLNNTLSKTAILKGSFDKYIENSKNKKGTSEVDNELLKLIEEWREELAKNIALRNPELNIYNLNLAVQRIIDRIIFLRIAEDRKIETYGLLANAAKTSNIYKSLNAYFFKANEKYNAGLFEQCDWLSDLQIDDKILANIIDGLYYPECPYEFSILPIEILGDIYEQFLGKTIRLTAGHQAKVEEKPEVRKAGGVYYTPKYIVYYIVENTIGEKIKNRTPEEISELTIIDPACGSGSFLVGAYSYLLNYHLEYYTQPKNINKALKNGRIYQASENSYFLSIEEKQKILLNNIYGVDIDFKAVEVTKLSLYLKLLENENVESQDYLFKHTDLKLLPDLKNNIKCGNSLIGSDYYKNKNLSLFDDNEFRKINVFDWEKEFPKIFKNQGADCVIGNPPWGQKAVEFSDDEKEYFKINYPSSSVGIPDLSRFFIEKSIKLLNPCGAWGQVLPDIILLKNYETTRKFILDTIKINKIDHWGLAFSQVNLDACTITGDKETFDKNDIINIFIHNGDGIISNKIKQSVFNNLESYKFNLFLNHKTYRLFKKIKKVSAPFSDFFEIHEGIHSGNIREKLFIKTKQNKNCKKIIIGKNEVKRYHLVWAGNWVNYSKEIIDKNEYAGLGKKEYFEISKIVIRRTGDYLLANIDENNYYFSNNLFVCIPKNKINLKYFLAILNSKLLTWFYRTEQPRVGKIFAEIKINMINQLPIIICKEQNKLIDLVNQMLETQKKLHSSKTEADKKMYLQRAEILDGQIDALVYDLYNLTKEEIKIIEESFTLK